MDPAQIIDSRAPFCPDPEESGLHMMRSGLPPLWVPSQRPAPLTACRLITHRPRLLLPPPLPPEFPKVQRRNVSPPPLFRAASAVGGRSSPSRAPRCPRARARSHAAKEEEEGRERQRERGVMPISPFFPRRRQSRGKVTNEWAPKGLTRGGMHTGHGINSGVRFSAFRKFEHSENSYTVEELQ